MSNFFSHEENTGKNHSELPFHKIRITVTRKKKVSCCQAQGASQKRRWEDYESQRTQMLSCSLGKTGKCTQELSTDMPMWMVEILQDLSLRSGLPVVKIY